MDSESILIVLLLFYIITSCNWKVLLITILVFMIIFLIARYYILRNLSECARRRAQEEAQARANGQSLGQMPAVVGGGYLIPAELSAYWLNFFDELGGVSSNQRRNLIAELPLVDKPPEEADQTCAICLQDTVDNMKWRHLPCNHYYHKDCVDGWMVNVGTCPVCRSDIFGQNAPVF